MSSSLPRATGTASATTRHGQPTSLAATRPGGLAAEESMFEGAFDRLLEGIDNLAPGARGELAHRYMMRKGYLDNAQRADALYQQVPEIDTYLDELNVSKVASSSPQGLTQGQIGAAAAGFAGGLLVAGLISAAT